MSGMPGIEEVQRLITRGPYHQWLGLKVLAVEEDRIEVRATWREEWMANPDRRHTHGGILAALIDLAGDWCLVGRLGRAVPTLDMLVDYHRAAMPGDLVARGEVVRFGATTAVCEARIVDLEGQLIATGRGRYYTAAART
jgi:uncharacterized protein (TIGR00369 family)